jgi:hydrogenase nickel incorporation protein HypA/HybF
MHELSIALSILDIAGEESQRRGGVSVKAIHVRLGPLSGVVKDALISAFDLAREASPFPDCVLVFHEVPLAVYCDHCRSEQPVKSPQLMCCSGCGRPAPRVVRGRELEISAMEVEEPSESAAPATAEQPAIVPNEA